MRLLILNLCLLPLAIRVVFFSLLCAQALLVGFDALKFALEFGVAPRFPLPRSLRTGLLPLTQLLPTLRASAASGHCVGVPVLGGPVELLELGVDQRFATHRFTFELPFKLLVGVYLECGLLRGTPSLYHRFSLLLHEHLDLLAAKHPLGKACRNLPCRLRVSELHEAETERLAGGSHSSSPSLHLAALLEDHLHMALLEFRREPRNKHYDARLCFGVRRHQRAVLHVRIGRISQGR
mmetsp:Transcript_93728/g.264599  ORF Transcript_93728/g.264599 Transcript_93728/m.264599 type:complete len:237 (+) Transcript_93728:493-1203(+)